MFECKIAGCSGAKHKGHGYCEYHYGRWRAGKEIDVPKRRHNPGAQCEADGCSNIARSNGFCDKHRARWKKHGDPSITKHSKEYGAGKDWYVGKGGYVLRWAGKGHPNATGHGNLYQHRHVMSEMIGRPLRKDENVHHKNGNRSDNRPENLELWTKGQPAGQRVQDRVKWHIHELLRDVDAALALDPTLRAEIEALAQSLKML